LERFHVQCNDILEIFTDQTYLNDDRIDLTSLETYTIDDPNTIEIDDAVSIEKEGSEYNIWIHIADPTSYIPFSSELDLLSRKRGITIYSPEKIITMLPRELSIKCFSLTANHVKPALSLSVRLGNDGSIKKYSLHKSFIKVKYNLTYEEAQELIELKPKEDSSLDTLKNLLIKRRQFRIGNGAIILEESQGRIIIKKNIPRLKIIHPNEARSMVSEAMILMGNSIALYGKNYSLTLPYRSQNKASFNKEHNYNRNLPSIIQNLQLKSQMVKASITTNPLPHDNLGVSCYVFATSPLRRYWDFITHIQINNSLLGGDIISSSEMNEIIDKTSISVKTSVSIEKNEKFKFLDLWFQRQRNDLFSAIFVRWLSFNNSIALIYIQRIEMTIKAKIINEKSKSLERFNNIAFTYIDSDLSMNSLIVRLK
tara:strand:- start:253 stop:1527 length:1275 start_codon:yes stop_codon:yes gene_type:complete